MADFGGSDARSALYRFALPIFLGNAIQSLSALINSAWVARLTDGAGLGATANANLIYFLVGSAVFGLGFAGTILVGQRWGAKDFDEARKTIGTGIVLFAGIGIVVAVLGFALAAPAVQAIGTPEPVSGMAASYLAIFFTCAPATLIFVFLTMSLRGAGDAVTPMLFTLPIAVLDLILNPIFILGMGPLPAMGVPGSAMASVVTGYTTLLALIVYIYLRKLPIRLVRSDLRYLRIDRRIAGTMIGLGIPMGLQTVAVGTADILMMAAINRQGVQAVAAFGAVLQIWAYVQIPCFAIGGAVTAMAAQFIGAGQWKSVEELRAAGIQVGMVCCGAAVATGLLAGPFVFWLYFGDNLELRALSSRISLIATPHWLLFGLSNVFLGIVKANGSVNAPLAITVVALILVRLGLALGLAAAFGFAGTWWSFAAGSGLMLCLSAGYYRLGDWRNAKGRVLRRGAAARE